MEMKVTSIDFSRQVTETLEAHGCKPQVPNLSIIPHTLGIVCNSYTMPTRFLSSIIHEVIFVRPEGIAQRSNEYY